MYVLGISAFYHDSAAALIQDGRIIAAAAEERFSRRKHDNGFPHQAIAFCLEYAEISMSDVATVAYYEKPLRKFERILDTFIHTYPSTLFSFARTLPEWLTHKIVVDSIIRKEVGYTGTIQYVPHHLSHAALAFYTSPFDTAAILTIDGVGEYTTTSLWRGVGTDIKHIASLQFPHSLGLFYSTVTAFLGFNVNEDESKVMGLAAFGTPRYLDKLSSMLRLHPDGSFELEMKYFSFHRGGRMWSKYFEEVLGLARAHDESLSERHKDIAASIQKLTEIVYRHVLQHLYNSTHETRLCIGGGVALNASANGMVVHTTPFTHVHIPGPAGDDGAAVGAALETFYRLCPTGERAPAPLALGTEYTDEQILEAIHAVQLPYSRVPDNSYAKQVAQHIAQGKIVAVFQGRMEFGPRALGCRSILADPRNPAMQTRVNALKERSPEHPCAGSFLAEHAKKYFDVYDAQPYTDMTFSLPVCSAHSRDIPAIVHKDGTCRLQTVHSGAYHTLIKEFNRITDIPCVLNTSFNKRGEPIVENPQQALNSFVAMNDIDYLSIGNFIVSRRRSTE